VGAVVNDLVYLAVCVAVFATLWFALKGLEKL
jgi:hypothetical protein